MSLLIYDKESHFAYITYKVTVMIPYTDFIININVFIVTNKNLFPCEECKIHKSCKQTFILSS